MKSRLFIFSLIACLALAACNITIGGNQIGAVSGTGDTTSEERPVSGVKRVAVTNQGDLTVIIGDQESLTIEAQANLLPYIETEVRGGTLEIRTQSGVNLVSTKPIRYTLTVPALEELTATSSGSITAPDLAADKFEINISSSGDVRIDNLAADNLEINLSSSGSAYISGGTVGKLDASLSSSGDVQMQDVVVEDARVTISSSGSAYLNVTGTLDGSISSSGDIHVSGDPQIDVSTSSSGKVMQK